MCGMLALATRLSVCLSVMCASADAVVVAAHHRLSLSLCLCVVDSATWRRLTVQHGAACRYVTQLHCMAFHAQTCPCEINIHVSIAYTPSPNKQGATHLFHSNFCKYARIFVCATLH